jgi:hypothetical protein
MPQQNLPLLPQLPQPEIAAAASLLHTCITDSILLIDFDLQAHTT